MVKRKLNEQSRPLEARRITTVWKGQKPKSCSWFLKRDVPVVCSMKTSIVKFKEVFQVLKQKKATPRLTVNSKLSNRYISSVIDIYPVVL